MEVPPLHASGSDFLSRRLSNSTSNSKNSIEDMLIKDQIKSISTVEARNSCHGVTGMPERGGNEPLNVDCRVAAMGQELGGMADNMQVTGGNEPSRDKDGNALGRGGEGVAGARRRVRVATIVSMLASKQALKRADTYEATDGGHHF